MQKYIAKSHKVPKLLLDYWATSNSSNIRLQKILVLYSGKYSFG